jgi:hypothetical protein
MEREALLRTIYAAFNARDIDAVLESMHPEIDWPTPGRAEVRHVYSFRDGLITRWTSKSPTNARVN